MAKIRAIHLPIKSSVKKEKIFLSLTNNLPCNQEIWKEGIIRSHLNRKQKSHFNEVGFRFMAPFFISFNNLISF